MENSSPLSQYRRSRYGIVFVVIINLIVCPSLLQLRLPKSNAISVNFEHRHFPLRKNSFHVGLVHMCKSAQVVILQAKRGQLEMYSSLWGAQQTSFFLFFYTSYDFNHLIIQCNLIIQSNSTSSTEKHCIWDGVGWNENSVCGAWWHICTFSFDTAVLD